MLFLMSSMSTTSNVARLQQGVYSRVCLYLALNSNDIRYTKQLLIKKLLLF